MKFTFLIEEDQKEGIETHVTISGDYTKILATFSTMILVHPQLRMIVKDALRSTEAFEEQRNKMPKPTAEA